MEPDFLAAVRMSGTKALASSPVVACRGESSVEPVEEAGEEADSIPRAAVRLEGVRSSRGGVASSGSLLNKVHASGNSGYGANARHSCARYSTALQGKCFPVNYNECPGFTAPCSGIVSRDLCTASLRTSLRFFSTQSTLVAEATSLDTRCSSLCMPNA